MALDRMKEQEFREAYSVLYRSEDEIKKAMDDFIPCSHVYDDVGCSIPNISNHKWKRDWVKDKLEGDNNPPYRTSVSFHFEDIKYIIGKSPIDIMYYFYLPNIVPEFLEDTISTANLAKNALNNTGVIIGEEFVAKREGESIIFSEYVDVDLTNKEFAEKISDIERNVSKHPKLFNDKYEGNLLVVEDFIKLGRHHDKDAQYYCERDYLTEWIKNKNLGIDNHSLVFSFIGNMIKDPDFDPIGDIADYQPRAILNVLRLI